jgi:iron(III) transport system permease protein
MVSKLKQILRNSVLIVLTGLVLYLVAVPIILLIWGGFKPGGLVSNPGFTLSNYVELYSMSRTYRLILNTVIFAVGSSFVALFFSTFLAWLIERTNIPFKTWLRTAIIAPMGVPPMLIAMGWVLLGSPKIGFFNLLLKGMFHLSKAPLNIYSFPGMMFVQGLTLVPGAFMLLCFTFRNMDPVFEDASTVSGVGVFSTLRRIVLPILRPALLASAILTFMISMAVFDIPGIIGLPARINVLSLQIYLAVQQPEGIPQFGIVSSLSSVFFVGILILSYIYNRQTRMASKFATITGREFRPKIIDLRNWRVAAIGFVGVYILLATGLPLAILFWQSLIPYYAPFSLDRLHLVSWDNYRTILDYPRLGMAIRNSIIVAVVAATALVFLATFMSWIIVRSKYRVRRVLDVVSVLPMALPHIMLGFALVYVYLTLKVGIYGTIWIIVIAYVTTYITYATRLLNSTMFQIHKELEEVAQVSGASLPRIFRTILMPLLAPSMFGLWIWVVIYSIRELSAALMLQSHKSLVLSTLLWHIWERGEIPKVAVIGVGMVVFLLIIMVLGQVLSRRFELLTGKR